MVFVFFFLDFFSSSVYCIVDSDNVTFTWECRSQMRIFMLRSQPRRTLSPTASSSWRLPAPAISVVRIFSALYPNVSEFVI
jgi:hypothetical protein